MTSLALLRGRTGVRLGLFAGLPLMLVAACVLTALYEPRFLRAANLMNVLRNASFLTVISAGQMMVMIVGGFDISVGAVVALTSVSTAMALVFLAGWGMTGVGLLVLGCLAGLLPALLLGLCNGLLVSFGRISPFMVTIGTMSIATGLAAYVTGGSPIYDLPTLFLEALGNGRLFGVPGVAFIAVAVVFGLWYLQSQSPYGRYFYAVGGNEKAARQTGIDTRTYICAAYIVSALLAGLTGILLTARVGSGEATLGGNLMLQSISVAVIAGVSLKGGVGKVQNIVLSSLFLSVLSNAMSLARIDSKYHVIVIGLVVLIAVWVEARAGSMETSDA
ncbi:ribose transport system permease protein [Sinorhizobium fredii]|uniref:Ribose transport system permease protein RbsC n=1 Tax=Sinorhizobium fredii (strain USDA 257) TaxID=1185652 RepID=I3X5A2_SINF2|nr:ABC transporter permease [Sinorhizobium fredii]AFL51058.1 ribose transport system permease protein RbsC [Sinorhizobium fredii USDA 257]